MNLAVVCCFLLCISRAIEQPTGLQSTQADAASIIQNLISREVLPDRRVTFRIHAPRAAEVMLHGDWLQPSEPIKLDKGELGIWSATVGPFAPDYYLYWFVVDGVRMPDPRNPEAKPGTFGSQSIVFVAGPGTEFMENKGLPHGELRQVWYHSTTFDMQRRMHVYTPPRYDSAGNQYPVLYLLHGGGENDSAWSGVGRAGFILDNLIAAQKATPMLVVMPEVPVPPARARFGDELLKDIVPIVEKTYRVRAERNGRALAGYSVGGYETLQMLTSHREEFGYVAVWSAPVEPKTVAAFAQEQTRFLNDSAEINKLLKLLWFRIGSEDMGAPHVKKLAELFSAHGIKHNFRVSNGGHRWQNWRRYLHEYAQEVFR